MQIGHVRTLVLVSWDGVSTPLALIGRDAKPHFDFVLLDYSGGDRHPETDLALAAVLRVKTECKGQIYTALHAHLAAQADSYDYVALIDDDISVTVSALNGSIALGAAADLDVFALSLAPESHFSHRRFIQRPGGRIRHMPWVEVMMPFYRRHLFMAAGPLFTGSISSYGLDQFAMPLACKVSGAMKIATIDAHTACHTRPITSAGKRYSNGLTAHQERRVLRRQCLDIVRREHRHFLATRWYYATFAPLDGPWQFWGLYMLSPWHLAVRVASSRRLRRVPMMLRRRDASIPGE